MLLGFFSFVLVINKSYFIANLKLLVIKVIYNESFVLEAV